MNWRAETQMDSVICNSQIAPLLFSFSPIYRLILYTRSLSLNLDLALCEFGKEFGQNRNS